MPTDMSYSRADALVVRRSYDYDLLGRPTARNLARYGTETQDTFGYNTRSELTAAHVNSADYSYAYDAIGNRTSATEAGTRTAYTANKLNQYTAEGSFRPTFDADGNQTLIKTSTGTWNVTYNAKNRPVRFEKSDNSVTVECTYDTMGRRATKKVTTNGTLTEHRRFLYRGYLQVACCDLTRAYTPALWFILWDPTQPTATRPLAIQKNGTWYTYGWDLTKNICETYRTDGRIDLAYTYTPYGEVSPAHTYDQPLRWSSEYHDVELGLVYYNYRHYNPAMGRWMGRDFQTIKSYFLLYTYVANAPIHHFDVSGMQSDNDYIIEDSLHLQLYQEHSYTMFFLEAMDEVNLNEYVTFFAELSIEKISKNKLLIKGFASANARPTCMLSDDVDDSAPQESVKSTLIANISCSSAGEAWATRSDAGARPQVSGSVSTWLHMDDGGPTPQSSRRIQIEAESGFKEKGLKFNIGGKSKDVSLGLSGHLPNAKTVASRTLTFYVSCKCGKNQAVSHKSVDFYER